MFGWVGENLKRIKYNKNYNKFNHCFMVNNSVILTEQYNERTMLLDLNFGEFRVSITLWIIVSGLKYTNCSESSCLFYEI